MDPVNGTTSFYAKTFDEALNDLIEEYLDDESPEEIIAALGAKLEEMIDAAN